jgi:hypothetical protein
VNVLRCALQNLVYEYLKKLENKTICKQLERTEKKAPIKNTVNKQHEHEEK